MKAIAIDSAVSRLTIAAKNDEYTVTEIFDIGMKQSETLLPAIDSVIKKAGFSPNKLDYTTFTAGPGSFTGLRLALSALKALELSTQAPIYAIPTLDVYSNPFKDLPQTVLCVIDAKKDRFYAKALKNSSVILNDGDYTPEDIISKLEDKEIILCGSDSKLFFESVKKDKKDFILIPFCINPAQVLFSLAEEYISVKNEPLKQYDGPIYIRASEAEIKHNQ